MGGLNVKCGRQSEATKVILDSGADTYIGMTGLPEEDHGRGSYQSWFMSILVYPSPHSSLSFSPLACERLRKLLDAGWNLFSRRNNVHKSCSISRKLARVGGRDFRYYLRC